jgi:hypothetical protein
MTFRPLTAAALLLALAPALPAEAQTATYVFQTVDAYEVDGNTVRITGIVQGEAQARTVSYPWSFGEQTTSYYAAQRCERLALLSVAKPGRYLFSVLSASTLGFRCKLALVPQN